MDAVTQQLIDLKQHGTVRTDWASIYIRLGDSYAYLRCQAGSQPIPPQADRRVVRSFLVPKSHPKEALKLARQVNEAWFRAQALSWVARFTDGDVLAIAAEAAKAAAEGDDSYQQCAVRA